MMDQDNFHRFFKNKLESNQPAFEENLWTEMESLLERGQVVGEDTTGLPSGDPGIATVSLKKAIWQSFQGKLSGMMAVALVSTASLFYIVDHFQGLRRDKLEKSKKEVLKPLIISPLPFGGRPLSFLSIGDYSLYQLSPIQHLKEWWAVPQKVPRTPLKGKVGTDQGFAASSQNSLSPLKTIPFAQLAVQPIEFVLPQKEPKKTTASTIEEIKTQIEQKIVAGDSTTYKVLDRHKKDWIGTVAVCDWTSSMFPYSTQLAVWLQKHPTSQPIDKFVFFNDCDLVGNAVSLSGIEGRFYEADSRNQADVLWNMTEAVIKGERNEDYEENDLEALWHAVQNYPEVLEFILIADNKSNVRNKGLLRKLKHSGKVFRIVICGNHFDPEVAFQPVYWELAKQSNGSLHTFHSDLESVKDIARNTKIIVGKREYAFRWGKFRWVR